MGLRPGGEHLGARAGLGGGERGIGAVSRWAARRERVSMKRLTTRFGWSSATGTATLTRTACRTTPSGSFPNRGNPNTVSRNGSSTACRETGEGRGDPAVAHLWSGGQRRDLRAWHGRDLARPARQRAGAMTLFPASSTWAWTRTTPMCSRRGATTITGLPKGLIKALGGDEDRMLLIGYAADGFPIYTSKGYKEADKRSQRSQDAEVELSAQEGDPTQRAGRGLRRHVHGGLTSTWRAPATWTSATAGRGSRPSTPDGTYYYALTEDFPFISRYF